MIHKKIILCLLLFSFEQLNCVSFFNQTLNQPWLTEDEWNAVTNDLSSIATTSDVVAMSATMIFLGLGLLFLKEDLFEYACNNNWPRIIKLFRLSDRLERAVRQGNLKIVSLLINHPDIDVNKHYPYLLFIAARKQNVEIVKLLLEHPGINFSWADPLYIAIEKQNLEIVKLLLKHPDIKIKEVDHLQVAVSKQHLELVKLLLKHPSIEKAPINLLSGHSEINYPMAQAISDDWLDGFKLLINPLLMPVNEKDYIGLIMLLSLAASRNATKIFKYLAKYLEDWLDIYPQYWKVPLEQAVNGGSANIIKRLSDRQEITEKQWLATLHTTPCTSKHLNRRNNEGLRPLDITSKWYLDESKKFNLKGEIYYKLLKETPSWSCQTLYECLLKKYPSRDVAQAIMESYLSVMIPKLPLNHLKSKIETLKKQNRESNKTVSTLLLTAK